MGGLTTKQICAKMERAVDMPIPHCQASAEQLWELAAKYCQKGADIEKLFCGMAGNKQKEDEIVGQMCAKVEDFQKKMFNTSMPSATCQTLVTNVWESATKMCHKDYKESETILSQAAASSIDSMFCMMLDNKLMEGLATKQICAKMERAVDMPI